MGIWRLFECYHGNMASNQCTLSSIQEHLQRNSLWFWTSNTETCNQFYLPFLKNKDLWQIISSSPFTVIIQALERPGWSFFCFFAVGKCNFIWGDMEKNGDMRTLFSLIWDWLNSRIMNFHVYSQENKTNSFSKSFLLILAGTYAHPPYGIENWSSQCYCGCELLYGPYATRVLNFGDVCLFIAVTKSDKPFSAAWLPLQMESS